MITRADNFVVKDALTDEEYILDNLHAGDVIVCESHTEHAVKPLRGGKRLSMNVDFWAVCSDGRSEVDRI